MNAPLARTTRILLAAIALGSSLNAVAGQKLMAIDAPFRAKIAKEKIRRLLRSARAESQGKCPGRQRSCGSQNIGNVNTNGRIGAAAPREVFVFAPNAINIVGRGGCR